MFGEGDVFAGGGESTRSDVAKGIDDYTETTSRGDLMVVVLGGIGERLKQLRGGLERAQLARMAEIEESKLDDVENGRDYLTYGEIRRIAAALHADAQYLAQGNHRLYIKESDATAGRAKPPAPSPAISPGFNPDSGAYRIEYDGQDDAELEAWLNDDELRLTCNPTPDEIAIMRTVRGRKGWIQKNGWTDVLKAIRRSRKPPTT